VKRRQYNNQPSHIINVCDFCFAIRGELLLSDLGIAQEDVETMLFSFDMDGSE
jgi:hypothetical protein